MLAIGMTWPVAEHLTTRLPGDLGDPLFVCWVLQWTAGQMIAAAHGHVGALANYWNGNIFYPERLTLAYSEHFTAQALQIAPIYGATGNIILCYNLLFLSTFVLAGYAMYLLTEALTHRRLASALAGVAFAYAPYRLGQFPHLQILSSYWMPLTLLGLRRFFDRSGGEAPRLGRARPLAGAAVAFLMLALSCTYYLLFFAPFVAAYAAYEIAGRRLWRDRRTWTALGVAAVCVAAILWPFLRPYAAVRETAGIGSRSMAEIDRFSADTYAFATAPRAARWLRGVAAHPAAEAEGFPGFTILTFAALGTAVSLRSALRRTSRIAREGARAAMASAAMVASGAGAVVTLWLLSTGNGRVSVTLPLCATAAALLVVAACTWRPGGAPEEPGGFGFMAAGAVAAALLALGPQIRAHGHVLGAGPYAILLHLVPGFDGLRVPARFLMLVTMFLSVLAGCGAAAIARKTTRRVAAVIIGVGIAGILEEAWMAPLDVNVPLAASPGLTVAPRPLTGPRVSPLYREVRDLGGPVVLLEFPFGDTAHDLLAVYYAGFHRRPLVNGYSGFFPRSYVERQALLADPARDPRAAAEAVRASGATHVLVHEGAFEGDRGRGVTGWLAGLGAGLVASDGQDRLLALPKPAS